jgi:hypothetical protein
MDGVDGVIDSDTNQAAPQGCRCITFLLSPDCCVGSLKTQHGDNSGMQEIILESRQHALQMARRLSLMHEGARYHALKKLSSPTTLPACVSAGSPAKRGNMISWLFAKFPCSSDAWSCQHIDRNPVSRVPTPALHSIRSAPPNFGYFFLTSELYITPFCFRCPISLYSQFHSKGLSDNTTQSGLLSLLKINTYCYTKSRHNTTVPGNDCLGRE